MKLGLNGKLIKVHGDTDKPHCLLIHKEYLEGTKSNLEYCKCHYEVFEGIQSESLMFLCEQICAIGKIT